MLSLESVGPAPKDQWRRYPFHPSPSNQPGVLLRQRPQKWWCEAGLHATQLKFDHYWIGSLQA
jgi:hypothetical protein